MPGSPCNAMPKPQRHLVSNLNAAVDQFAAEQASDKLLNLASDALYSDTGGNLLRGAKSGKSSKHDENGDD